MIYVRLEVSKMKEGLASGEGEASEGEGEGEVLTDHTRVFSHRLSFSTSHFTLRKDCETLT